MTRARRMGWREVLSLVVLGAAGSVSASPPAPDAPRAQGQAPDHPEDLRDALAGTFEEITVTLADGVQLVMVRIPAGTFTMGSPESEPGRYSSEGPQHQVTISQPFYLGKYEVTQAQWQALMGTSRPEGCGSYGEGDNYPVYCVSWRDICGQRSGFLRRLNDHLLATGQWGGGTMRLPTEAEWEYAARAGTTTRFSFGEASECDDPCEPCATYEDSMWWCGNALYHTSTPGARPVGQKLANPWGLFDMHGNVLEWVSDLYGPYETSPVSDPTGPSTGTYRVIRGGAWGFRTRSCRSARRNVFIHRGNFNYRYHYLGFRLASSL